MRLRSQKRRGSVVVESALVYPIVFLLLLGMVVGAAGTFRYQEMAALAREAARYASTHGTDWAAATNHSAKTPSDIYNDIIAAKAVSLDMSKLSYSITYNTSNAPTHSVIVNGETISTVNMVTVTISYNWVPEAFLGGITLTSTSCVPMSF